MPYILCPLKFPNTLRSYPILKEPRICRYIILKVGLILLRTLDILVAFVPVTQFTQKLRHLPTLLISERRINQLVQITNPIVYLSLA